MFKVPTKENTRSFIFGIENHSDMSKLEK